MSTDRATHTDRVAAQAPEGAPTGSDAVEQDSLADIIAAETAEVAGDMVQWRRDLHRHPEPSWSEHRTTARIRGVLEALGLDPRPLSTPTGLWVDIQPPKRTLPPRIGLRADIDALQLMDGKDVPYRSVNSGVAHACGHDVHTALLLGSATVLTRLRDRGLLPRGVRLFFQPAEETSPGGAGQIIRDGGMSGLREVYALHCDPRTEVGKVAVRPGPITSACDRVQVHFAGPGGHSSRPHLTADLVMAMGAVITEVPLLLSRLVDPRAGASVVWGHVNAGNAPNAIPATGLLEGTLRVLDLDGWHHARNLVPDLVRKAASPFGVHVEVELAEGIPPTVNHPKGANRIAAVGRTLLGDSGVVDTEQSLGGEDFSEMLLEVPGALGRLGVRPVDVSDWPDLHRPMFDVDEACLEVGAKTMVGLVALRG
ncbi:MAG: amidohydrolase [Propionibacteriaceae bacterium]|nr:amidohydrolase [Propionibacteriaceae bacterium]